MATTTLSQTTITAAINATQTIIPVASATGIVAEGSSEVPGSLLYVVDPGQKRGEAMIATSISGLSIGVRRVDFGVPHVSGATIYHGRPDKFYDYNPAGSVVAANAAVTPWINVETGEIWIPSPVTLSWIPIASAGLQPPLLTTVSAQAATATLVAGDFGKILTNTGAGGAIVLTLPAASAVAGQSIKVQLTVAQTVTLTPVTGEKVWLGGSGVASKYLLGAGVIGNYAVLVSDGVGYFVTDYAGVWTKEA